MQVKNWLPLSKVCCLKPGAILHTRIVTAEYGHILKWWYHFTLHLTWVPTVHVSRLPTTWQTMCRVEYLKRNCICFDIGRRSHFRLYSVSKFPGELSHDAGFFVVINYFYQIQICALCANRYETAHDATKTTCADWEKTIFRSKYIGYLDWINIFRSGYITSGAYLDRHMIIRHI